MSLEEKIRESKPELSQSNEELKNKIYQNYQKSLSFENKKRPILKHAFKFGFMFMFIIALGISTFLIISNLGTPEDKGPDIPDIPDIPDTPDIPDIPDTPDIPDIPDNPDDPLVLEWDSNIRNLMLSKLGLVLPFVAGQTENMEIDYNEILYIIAEGNEELLERYYQKLIADGFHVYESMHYYNFYKTIENNYEVTVNIGIQNGYFFVEAYKRKVGFTNSNINRAMSEIFSQNLPLPDIGEYEFVVEDNEIILSSIDAENVIEEFSRTLRLRFFQATLLTETEAKLVKLEYGNKVISIDANYDEESGLTVRYYYEEPNLSWQNNDDEIILNWLNELLPFPMLTSSYEIMANEDQLIISDIFNWQMFECYQQALLADGYKLVGSKHLISAIILKKFSYQYQKTIDEINYNLTLDINMLDFKIIIEKGDKIEPAGNIEGWNEEIIAFYEEYDITVPLPALTDLLEYINLGYGFYIVDRFANPILPEYRQILVDNGFIDFTDPGFLDGTEVNLLDFGHFSKKFGKYVLDIYIADYLWGVEMEITIYEYELEDIIENEYLDVIVNSPYYSSTGPMVYHDINLLISDENPNISGYEVQFTTTNDSYYLVAYIDYSLAQKIYKEYNNVMDARCASSIYSIDGSIVDWIYELGLEDWIMWIEHTEFDNIKYSVGYNCIAVGIYLIQSAKILKNVINGEVFNKEFIYIPHIDCEVIQYRLIPNNNKKVEGMYFTILLEDLFEESYYNNIISAFGTFSTKVESNFIYIPNGLSEIFDEAKLADGYYNYQKLIEIILSYKFFDM